MEAMFTGVYVLKIVRVFAVCALLVQGLADVGTVSVNKGDSVTLHTGIKTNRQVRIKWYFHNIRIANMYGDQSWICTDNDCKEIFMKRLKLDSNTGDLTITHVKASDSGAYKLLINSSSDRDKTFNVAVHSVSGWNEMERVSVREGKSVTLDPSPMVKNVNNLMKWHFNETHIAEISEDPSYTCPDVQCDGGNIRFRDRLKLDSQTGSLTITNTRSTDSGEYRLKIIDCTNSFSITTEKKFRVSVTGPSSATTGEISAFVVLVVFGLIFVVIAFWWKRRKSADKGKDKHRTVDEVAEEHDKLTPPPQVEVILEHIHMVQENYSARLENLENSELWQNHPLSNGRDRPRRWAHMTENLYMRRDYEPLTPPSLAKVICDSIYVAQEKVDSLRRRANLQNLVNSELQQIYPDKRRQKTFP